MEWIGKILDQYRGHTIIFLSYHNVLDSFGEENTSHIIQNPGLSRFLRWGGVKLVITGHMHARYITKKDGLWEILSGKPFSGGHFTGCLAVGRDILTYYAELINFASYDRAVG